MQLYSLLSVMVEVQVLNELQDLVEIPTANTEGDLQFVVFLGTRIKEMLVL